MPPHVAECQYGHLFSYVPGDSGNPFVALWQATLLNAIVLGVAAVLLLYTARLIRRVAPRVVGFSYLGVGTLMGVLAAVIAASATPLTCNGVPGAPPLTASEQRAYDTFVTFQTVATFALYLTVLLVAAAVVALALFAVTRRRGIRQAQFR